MFRLEQRAIYQYPNGKRGADGAPQTVWGDPLLILRRFKESLRGDDIETVFAHLESPTEADEVILPAMDKLAAAARLAFGVTALDPETGEGLTVDECLGLLGDFMEWLDTQKKVSGSTPSLSEHSDSVLPFTITANTSVST